MGQRKENPAVEIKWKGCCSWDNTLDMRTLSRLITTDTASISGMQRIVRLEHTEEKARYTYRSDTAERKSLRPGDIHLGVSNISGEIRV